MRGLDGGAGGLVAPRFTCGRFGGWESSVTDLIRGLTLASPFTKDWVGFAIHVSVNYPASPDLEVTPGRMSSAIRLSSPSSNSVLALIRSPGLI